MAGFTIGCAGAPTPCLGPNVCPKTTECLAARCVPFSPAPVAASAQRRFATPSRIAIVSAETPRDPGPSAVLGATPAQTLYLDFPPIWRGARVTSAFLVLTRAPATAPSDDIPVEVLRIQSPWSTPVPTRGHPSRLALPRAVAAARSFPRLPVRIDVTALVQKFATTPSYGLAVRATRTAPPGIALSTGLSGDPPPRLEIFIE